MCPARDELDAFWVVEETLVLVGAVLPNDRIFLGYHLRPVDGQVNGRQAWVARMGSIINQTSGFDQILGGETAPVGAGSSDGALFGHGDRFAQFGGV